MHKRIILGKYGGRVYFIKRDNSRKVDCLMSVQLEPTRSDTDEMTLETKIMTIYESFESRIIFADFDYLTE